MDAPSIDFPADEGGRQKQYSNQDTKQVKQGRSTAARTRPPPDVPRRSLDEDGAERTRRGRQRQRERERETDGGAVFRVRRRTHRHWMAIVVVGGRPPPHKNE